MDKKKEINLEKLLHQYYKEIDLNLKKKYDRSLPFQDAVFDRWERAKILNFGYGSSIYNSSMVFGDIKVGKNTWIGPNTMLDGSGGGIKIGNFCSISTGVQIYTHDTVLWSLSGGHLPLKNKSVTIGNNNYIGSQSIINLGVEIGNNCIIAANSFVNCNVPNRSIFGGSPAKKIGEVVGEKENVTLKYNRKKE